MITVVEIQNFRCFRELRLRDLKRMNVLVGESASGKTAFLEALFLASGGSPHLAWNIQAWRGLPETLAIKDPRRAAERLFGDLFHRFELDSSISIRLEGEGMRRRALTISWRRGDDYVLPLLKDDAKPEPPQLPLEFAYQIGDGPVQAVAVEVVPEGIRMGAIQDVHSGIFFTSRTAYLKAAVSRFSDLSKSNNESTVIEALRAEYPFIQNVTIEEHLGTSVLYAHVPGLRQKLPLEDVSAGAAKYFSLLVGAAVTGGGFLLIDEIENGLYYKTLPGFWRALFSFCRRFDVQVFATTHSAECLGALAATANGFEKEICLMKSRRRDSHCTITAFHGLDFVSAIRQATEVR